MIRLVKLYYKAIVWVFIITYLCFVDGSNFNKPHINIPHLDKIVHFVMFFILGILLGIIGHIKHTRFNIKWLPFIAIIYGGVIEIVQQLFIPTRSGDVFDWVADTVGLIVGIVLFLYIPNKIKQKLLISRL
jgi:VanZ family protein